jgi:hypothetical protein
MFCLYCKLDSMERSGIKKTIDKASGEKKKTHSSKGQKQARTRSVAGVLYSALVYNCWCCCSGQLQILLLLLLVLVLVLLLLLQWQQTKSDVKKTAACGDMHGNWGACSKCKQTVPKLFLFFLPL